jgi:AraC-like DNA-binding protein
MDVPEGTSGLTRAEIPHIRFLLAGDSVLKHGQEEATFGAPDIIVCGPSLRSGHAAVSRQTTIMGSSITPLGWQALLGCPMNEMANRKAPLSAFRKVDARDMIERALSAGNDDAMFGHMDAFFRSLIRETSTVNTDFIKQATNWLLDEYAPEVEAMQDVAGISYRQLDRRCKTYFGAAPKRLHRIFRTLHVSNALAWTGETDWKHVAGEQFYDQAHLIRDFKEFIGCTPGEYIRGRNMMIRFDLEKRMEIPHPSGFSLIG